VQDAGLQLSQIEDVILVGGQTRMPRVREAISSLFQREPSRTVHPEEVVAIGAAVHAASLSDSNLGATVLLDVTPFDLGIDVAGGLFQPVITRNSHVPAVGTRTFATAHDNQESVKVTVRQGESRFSVENEFLGEFVMNGLTAAPRMQTKVDVQFRLDSNGILFITSSEQGTGERKKVTIRNYAQVAQGGGQAQVEVEGETSGAAQKSPIATAPAPEKAPKGGLGAIGFLDRIFGRGKKAGDRPTSQVAQPAAPPPLAEAPAPVFATYEDLPEMDAPEALPDDALFGEEADPPEDFGALVPLDEDVPAFPLDGSDEDDEGPEPLPVGLPASRGPDPYAHGGDDPFGIGGGDDEGDDSFAMPLDEEVGYGAEESWDRSLSAPLSLPEDELEPEPTPLPLTPPPAAASRPGPLTPDPFADEGEDTDLQRLRRRPPSGDRSARRKPARLKLAYRRADAMVVEYLDNLRRGGCFVKTEKPLPVGRECIIEVRSPGLREPLHIAGVVSWSSADQASLPPGQAEGMGIEYRLDEGGREEIVRVLEGLVG
jgi:Tfp pilus assembly protein PilZ